MDPGGLQHATGARFESAVLPSDAPISYDLHALLPLPFRLSAFA